MHPTQEMDEMRSSVPGAFQVQLYHLKPIETILFQKIANFFTFILGGQFLLLQPQRANNGKGGSSNFKIEWDKGFSEPGVFKLVHLQPIEPILYQKVSYFFTFIILDGQFITPEG